MSRFELYFFSFHSLHCTGAITGGVGGFVLFIYLVIKSVVRFGQLY